MAVARVVTERITMRPRPAPTPQPAISSMPFDEYVKTRLDLRDVARAEQMKRVLIENGMPPDHRVFVRAAP